MEIRIEKSEEQSIMTEKPVATRPDIPMTPVSSWVQADDGESLLIVENESSPSVSTPEVSIQAQPVSIQTQEDVQTAPSLVWVEWTQSLREIQLARMSATEDVAPISSENENLLGNLFWWTEDQVTMAVPVESQEISQIQVPELTAEEIEQDAEKVAERFDNPMTFIEASIKKIEWMIAHIEEAHSIKLEEALGFKTEKERNAALEEGCYMDAEKMMKERAHAEKMRKYFISQRDLAEWDAQWSTVETTLTTLAVKKSVDDATENEVKKHSKKQAKEEVEIA